MYLLLTNYGNHLGFLCNSIIHNTLCVQTAPLKKFFAAKLIHNFLISAVN